MDLSIFGYYQMEEIRLGLVKNLDVAVYASPEFNSDQMRKMRKELEKSSSPKKLEI
jgi:hypothetical protein